MFSKLITIVWTGFLLYTFVVGLGDALAGNPSDGMFLAQFVLSAALHFFLWIVVIVPVFIIGKIFARKERPEQTRSPAERPLFTS